MDVNSAVANVSHTADLRSIRPPAPGPGLDVVGHLRIPGPKTVFDGDDHDWFDPSFDIHGAAARVLATYDRDGDGTIDLDAKGIDETFRFTGSGTASIRALAEYADREGDGDGSVTVQELAAAIARFDQGAEGDGRLSGQERETFLEVFGEQRNDFFVPTFPRRAIPVHPVDLKLPYQGVEALTGRSAG